MLEYGNYIIFDKKEEFLREWKITKWNDHYFRGQEFWDMETLRIIQENVNDYISKVPFAIYKFVGEGGCRYETVSVEQALETMLGKTSRQIEKLQKIQLELLERLGVDN